MLEYLEGPEGRESLRAFARCARTVPLSWDGISWGILVGSLGKSIWKCLCAVTTFGMMHVIKNRYLRRRLRPSPPRKFDVWVAEAAQSGDLPLPLAPPPGYESRRRD